MLIDFGRLKYMFSFYNMIAAYIAYAAVCLRYDKRFKYVDIVIDIIRAKCIFVALVVIYYYLKFGFDSPRRFYSKILGLPKMSLLTAYLIDVFVHFLPVILLGLPRNVMSYIFAYLDVIIWYVLVRKHIVNVYGNELGKNHMDRIILVYAPLVVIACVTFQMLPSNK